MNTITDVLSQNGIPYRMSGQHHHVRTGWIGVDCPYCGTLEKFHLGFNLGGRFASCWKCGRHTLADALANVLKTDFASAKRLLAGLGWVDARRPEVARTQLRIPTGVMDLQAAHIRYLKGRGFDPDELKQLWEIKGIGLHPQLNWRVWIPIHFQGELVSWTTRSIGDSGKRYRNAAPHEESKSPKTFLYGQHYARSSIVICEGPTDVWRLGPGAVATMGLQFKQSQFAWMTRYAERWVCFDNSVAAKARARHLADQLSLFPGSTHMLELDAEDPGAATKKEVRQVRRLIFGDSYA